VPVDVLFDRAGCFAERRFTDEERSKVQQAIIALKRFPADYAKDCNLWEGEVTAHVIAELGKEVQYGDVRKRLI